MGVSVEALKDHISNNRPTEMRQDAIDALLGSRTESRKWWQDRINWPRLPSFRLRLPVMYDPHESFVSSLDIMDSNPKSNTGNSPTTEPPSTFLQRLILH